MKKLRLGFKKIAKIHSDAINAASDFRAQPRRFVNFGASHSARRWGVSLPAWA